MGELLVWFHKRVSGSNLEPAMKGCMLSREETILKERKNYLLKLYLESQYCDACSIEISRVSALMIVLNKLDQASSAEFNWIHCLISNVGLNWIATAKLCIDITVCGIQQNSILSLQGLVILSVSRLAIVDIHRIQQNSILSVQGLMILSFQFQGLSMSVKFSHFRVSIKFKRIT